MAGSVCSTGELMKLEISVLQDLCKIAHLPITGPKILLANRLEECFLSPGSNPIEVIQNAIKNVEKQILNLETSVKSENFIGFQYHKLEPEQHLSSFSSEASMLTTPDQYFASQKPVACRKPLDCSQLSSSYAVLTESSTLIK